MAEPEVAVIRHITLYKHGVAFFKREAQVEGDGLIELQFKSKEMNDVLKSLTVYDADGGLIPAVSYEGRGNESPAGELGLDLPDPADAEDFGAEIPADRALTGLLARLVGVKVAFESGGVEFRGEILGLERVRLNASPARGAVGTQMAGPSGRADDELRLVLRGDDGMLRSLPLFEASQIRILDEKADEDLGRFLARAVYWKKKEARKISVYARGSGERRVALSYAIEAPVWKTSYRVLLPAEQTSGSAMPESGVLRLQGWALIDNTHDEDWDDVRISLVAGLPISFTHDLYSPRYQERPEIAVDRGAAYGAPDVRRGLHSLPLRKESVVAPRMAARAMAGTDAPDLDLMMDESAADPGEMSLDAPEPSGLAGAFDAPVGVTGGELDGGNAYVYHLEHPVSVERGQSALVPILAADFEGSRAALYSPQIRAGNPMACILFKNSTAQTLEGGPLTVFDQDSYAGEGMLKLCKPGEKQFIPYAVDLGCRISIDHESTQLGVFRSVIVHGAWSLYHRLVAFAIYNINNEANAHPLDLYLEHGIRPGWRLAAPDSDEPAIAPRNAGTSPQSSIIEGELYETTDRHYRFRVRVPAGEAVRFVVREIGSHTDSYSIQNLDAGTLSGFAAHGYLDEDTRILIEKLIELQNKAGELSRRLQDLENEMQELDAGQERLRENLKSFSGRADEEDLRQRYLDQFRADEDRFAALKSQISDIKSEMQDVGRERDRLLTRASLDLMLDP